MFRCACSSELGTWRSALLSIFAAFAFGGVVVMAVAWMGYRSDDAFPNRWVEVSAAMLVPVWMTLGLVEGRQIRRRRHG